MEAIGRLLRTPPRLRSHAGLDAFVAALEGLEGSDGVPDSAPAHIRTFARAMRMGAVADRLGFAFVAGYHNALACLSAQSGSKRQMPVRASLAVSESGGNHPRAIATKLTPDPRRTDMLRLEGEKTFATMGPVADVFFVAATEGDGEDGRPRLRVVRVGARASGVSVELRPPTSFAPEIPHARVRLEGVSVSPLDVLPGDGYARYLKPFRTHEDVHVLAATLSWLIVVARTKSLPPVFADVLVGQLHALSSIASAPEGSAHAHVGLAGVFASVRKVLVQHHQALADLPDEIGPRFARDLPLLDVAEAARSARTAAAWSAILDAKGSIVPPAT